VFIITTIGLECLPEKEYTMSHFPVFPGENIYGEKFYKFINLSSVLIYITFVHNILMLLFFDIPDGSVAKIKKIIKVNISIFGLLFLFLNKTLLISHPVLMLTTGCFSGILFFSREKYFDVSLLLYPVIAFCALVFSHALSSCASLIIMLIDTLFINRRNLNIDLVYLAGSIAYGAVSGFIGAIIPAIFSEKN
jgi:hypothetical protein